VLYAFGFERIGVFVSDLYFVDPDPTPGQEGAERGARLELRFLQGDALRGSIYSAQPISVDRPIWRCDLLESVTGPAGSHDRTHHHPRFDGWEPGHRVFVEELSAAPLTWLGDRLGDLPTLLAEAGVDPTDIGVRDAADLRTATPEILEATASVLRRVRAGEFASPRPDQPLDNARAGWL
jgi:hypothetical protein